MVVIKTGKRLASDYRNYSWPLVSLENTHTHSHPHTLSSGENLKELSWRYLWGKVHCVREIACKGLCHWSYSADQDSDRMTKGFFILWHLKVAGLAKMAGSRNSSGTQKGVGTARCHAIKEWISTGRYTEAYTLTALKLNLKNSTRVQTQKVKKKKRWGKMAHEVKPVLIHVKTTLWFSEWSF